MKTTIKYSLFIPLLISFAFVSEAQYYGGGYRRQAPPPPPSHEKDDDGYAAPSGFLSVNFGFATPEGSFAQSFGSGYGGYAEPGSVFHFSLGIPVAHSNFGVALMYGNYENDYNLNSYCNINGFISAPADNTYAEQSIMGGLFFTYPLGRLSIDARAMIGALLCSLPEQDYYTEDAMLNEYQYDMQASNSTALAFDAGIGLRFLIIKFGRRPLCAMVNVDYLSANPSYSTEQIVYESPYVNPTGVVYQLVPNPTFSGHLPISILNVTFGLGYQLGK